MQTVVFEAYPKVSLEAFLPELSLEIPELSDDILMHYVRNAAIEFAERSLALQREITMCLQPCVPDYILEAPDCMRIVSLHKVKTNGKRAYADCAQCCVFDDLQVMWQKPDILWVRPVPVEPQEITVVVSVAPHHDACELDEILLTRYKEAILAGTRAQLYGLQRRPWTSLVSAVEQRKEFDRRIAAAGTDRLLQGRTGRVRMQTIFNRSRTR
ncbi:hypothetical protein F9643_003137 [Escherichia coli]|uniref:hypothetical protein n=1 Tax=Escherichia coli TaxID=562 RepID=UPI000BDF96DB|nr:hypothetical protein [Escherichia coli]EER0916694.1 hypothetical protein [Escherichia coli O168:H8]EES8553783.1 hypothetical protein [Escherichia coli O168]EER0947464.1 hypothetical protein [Escherichia coli O168:H8]EER2485461.1 hypothetical protein [Escherichia coli]EER2541175.1 hypothetical protein [Escherichia coli]